MNIERIAYLYQRYQAKALTEQEEQDWALALSDFSNEEVLLDLIDESWYANDAAKHSAAAQDREKIYQYIVAQPQAQKREHRIGLWGRIAAAAVITFVSVGIYFFSPLKQQQNAKELMVANDIAPGQMGATLTLSNGKKIRLNDLGVGALVKEAGVKLTKTADGQLVYEIQNGASANGNNNTLTTGKGEMFILSLPDKSKIWLNAASSLTYTTSLLEKGERRVKLIGEAYFEIAKDRNHPFIVAGEKQQVEVLGTHFNVDNYEENSENKTTLLLGAIKISSKNGVRILKPGQQARLSNNAIHVEEVNAEDAVAWKNGYFMFNIERLETVMQKISRWYNVAVVFEDPELKNKTFLGTISRFENVSKVLNMLERTDVAKFKIENRTIKISEK